MKILMLTGTFGIGHVSVANAIRRQLEHDFPEAEICVMDFLEYALGTDAIYKAFNLLVNRGQSVFNHFYYRTESAGDSIGVPLKRFFFAAFYRLLEMHRPDIVISTLLFTSQLAGKYKEQRGAPYALITCVTDTRVHSDWIAPCTEAYMVPCIEARQNLIDAGVEHHRIFVSGMPLKPGFYPACTSPPASSKDWRSLLFLGGGLGLITEKSDFFRRLDSLQSIKTTVLCGSNNDLRQKLESRYENITAVGFISNVGDYMRNADLAIGKPGGVTLFEAIACRLPFLSVEPFLAQEIYNADFLCRHNMGRILTGCADERIEKIKQMIWDDQALESCKAAMGRVEATFDKNALTALIKQITRTEAA